MELTDKQRINRLSPIVFEDVCLDEYDVKTKDGKIVGAALSERTQGDRTNKEAVLSFIFNNKGALIATEVYVPSIKETFSFVNNATDELE